MTGQQQQRSSPVSVPRPLVMVAEDDDDLREFVCEQLARDDYEIMPVASGTIAMEKIDQAIHNLSDFRMPDLLITDFRMPGNDGLDLIAYAGFVPSILITAFPSKALRAAAHKIGADYVFEKPFAVRDLRRAASDLLS